MGRPVDMARIRRGIGMLRAIRMFREMSPERRARHAVQANYRDETAERKPETMRMSNLGSISSSNSQTSSNSDSATPSDSEPPNDSEPPSGVNKPKATATLLGVIVGIVVFVVAWPVATLIVRAYGTDFYSDTRTPVAWLSWAIGPGIAGYLSCIIPARLFKNAHPRQIAGWLLGLIALLGFLACIGGTILIFGVRQPEYGMIEFLGSLIQMLAAAAGAWIAFAGARRS